MGVGQENDEEERKGMESKDQGKVKKEEKIKKSSQKIEKR